MFVFVFVFVYLCFSVFVCIHTNMSILSGMKRGLCFYVYVFVYQCYITYIEHRTHIHQAVGCMFCFLCMLNRSYITSNRSYITSNRVTLHPTGLILSGMKRRSKSQPVSARDANVAPDLVLQVMMMMMTMMMIMTMMMMTSGHLSLEGK